MNKGELVAALSAKTEMTKKDSEAALNALIDVIGATIAAGDKVQLIGFGTFEAPRPRGPQPPYRRRCEDRRVQGPRFQGRQGSEGQGQQVISVFQRKPQQTLRFFCTPEKRPGRRRGP